MIVIADSSALIALATCSALDLAVSLYSDIYVPRAVYQEISHPGKPHAQILSQFLHGRVVEADKKQFVIAVGGLGEGEVEAMVLYHQLNAYRLLIDDRRARRVAEANGIDCVGSLGLLLLAKHDGYISELAPYVNKLRHSALHYSDTLLVKVLELAGEL